MRFGVLDSAPVCAGGSVADALAGSLARAGRLEELGCHRLWFTEHHLAPDVASSSPLTLVAEAATRTRRMRLGAGGVMIRNHAPLVAAEQAATLSLLHPGRVDVGLGRSGGSEPTTDLRIRRTVLHVRQLRRRRPGDRPPPRRARCRRCGGLRPGRLARHRDLRGAGGSRSGGGRARRARGHGPDRRGLPGALPASPDHPGAPGRDRPYVVALPARSSSASSDDEARWWHRCVQQRYLDRLRTGGAPLRGPDDVELDWSGR